jgi:uroporphyrinogen III methyltransferase/synthase
MKRVLITRPRAQSDSFADALCAAGFEPIFFPVIEIRPVENNAELDSAIRNIKKYAWVVFTSVNTIDVVFAPSAPTLPPQVKGVPSPFGRGQGEGIKIAAIGPKTAEALRKHHIEPDFIPEEYTAEAILPGLGNLKNKWVLLPRAEIAPKTLPEAIFKAGGTAHEITVYQTLPAIVDEAGLNAIKDGVDFVTFTSPSTVENFAAIVRQKNLDPLHLPNSPTFACIGSVTEKAARNAGFENIIVAKEYTTEGLIEAIRLKA